MNNNEQLKRTINKYGLTYGVTAQLLNISKDTVAGWYRTKKPFPVNPNYILLLDMAIQKNGLKPIIE